MKWVHKALGVTAAAACCSLTLSASAHMQLAKVIKTKEEELTELSTDRYNQIDTFAKDSHKTMMQVGRRAHP